MGFIDTFNSVFVDTVDKRTESWPLTDSAYSVAAIFIIYFLFSFFIGPWYMKNRKPYSLKRFIQFYNIFQVVANAYLVYSFLDAGWYQDVWLYCVELDYATTPGPMKIAWTIYLVAILKFIDLIETGIYVLRKKNDQISGLHLYHHITTALFSWLGVRYLAIGMAGTIPLVNCFVHVIMYSYYFLSTLGPNVVKKILPYKPLITIIQMVQFVLLICYVSQSLLPSCHVPKIPGISMIINLIINFYLFYNFYQNAYKSTKTKKK